MLFGNKATITRHISMAIVDLNYHRNIFSLIVENYVLFLKQTPNDE